MRRKQLLTKANPSGKEIGDCQITKRKILQIQAERNIEACLPLQPTSKHKEAKFTITFAAFLIFVKTANSCIATIVSFEDVSEQPRKF